MRRIKITEERKALAQEYASELEKENLFKKGESPKARLLALSNNLKKASTSIKILKSKGSKKKDGVYTYYNGNKYTVLSDYVRAIYDHYDGLNSLLPSEYDDKISQHVERILARNKISGIKVKLPKKSYVPFYELIVEAMRYDKVQKDLMPKYIKRLGIKTCVYCNAQFATTSLIQEIKNDKKGKFTVKTVDIACYELDHNMPKSIYPYLCTNFFNLQPSCSSCNRRKNNRELDFSLYYENGDIGVRPVHFILNPADVIKFRITNNGKNIKPFLCNEGTDIPPVVADNTSIVGKLNQMLGIQGIYDEHEDIVEEILWKHKIYSKGFISAIQKQIKSLGITGFDMKRFILGGYYGKEDDFLKQPLSIMKNDLWEQLKRSEGDHLDIFYKIK